MSVPKIFYPLILSILIKTYFIFSIYDGWGGPNRIDATATLIIFIYGSYFGLLELLDFAKSMWRKLTKR